MRFNLKERTSDFSVRIINSCKKIKLDIINSILVKQLVRSSTSIGANYAEADEAYSKKDFKHKISISRKECKETIYWLELMRNLNIISNKEIKPLIQEAKELNLIFSSIIKKIN